MRAVESISFPRSGHKLTTDWLRAYFGPSFTYAGEPHEGGDIPGTDFLKRHDFDLAVEIHPDRRYLVQVRDPFESMYSWFKMTVEADGIPNSRELFCKIFDERLNYWAGFVRKWILTPYPNVWVFQYRELLAFPEEALSRMIHIFDEIPCAERVSEIVTKEIPPIRSAAEPRFFL